MGYRAAALVLISLLACASRASAGVDLDLFLQDRTPLGSIGFYSSGCLDSAYRINGGEPGLLKLFIERERWYGNPEMIDLLGELGLAYDQEWREAPMGEDETPVERIQIGDIAQKGGGRVSRHASHQTGLDADIVYMRRDHRETRPDRGSIANFDESFVKNGKVTPNLDDVRQWWVWKWVYRTHKVERIFVDPRIKKFFCERSEALEPDDSAARTAILRLLRPYANHMDHFHMRLVCPPGDVKCVVQTPIPPGSGCGASELSGGGNEVVGPKPPASALAEDDEDPSQVPEPQPDAHHLPKECSDHGHFPDPRAPR